MNTSKSLGFILWGPSMSVKWTDLRATVLVWLLTSLLTNTEVETYGCTCALRESFTEPGCSVCLQVSIVKSEETKVRQEDLSKLLYEVQLLRTQQDNMECQMQDMKQ